MDFNNRLQSMTQDVIAKLQLVAHCQTCGQEFLRISAAEYFEKSHHFKDGSPDKWFVETGIHWVENDGHIILLDHVHQGVIGQQVSINEIWEKKLEDDRTREPLHSKDDQRPHFYKYRKMCENKPI